MLVLLVITVEILVMLFVVLGGLLMKTSIRHRRERLAAIVIVLSRGGRCRRS